MENHIMNIMNTETVIDYIESHLDEKLDLEKVSEVAHYSKYHLHRTFTNTVGMTIHDYTIYLYPFSFIIHKWMERMQGNF